MSTFRRCVSFVKISRNAQVCKVNYRNISVNRRSRVQIASYDSMTRTRRGWRRSSWWSWHKCEWFGDYWNDDLTWVTRQTQSARRRVDRRLVVLDRRAYSRTTSLRRNLFRHEDLRGITREHVECSAVIPRTNEGCLVRCWERYHRRKIGYVSIAYVLLRPIDTLRLNKHNDKINRALLLALHAPLPPPSISLYLLSFYLFV